MGTLEDKVIIVTGGGNGIGRAYCQMLAGEGANVVVADIDGAAAQDVADLIEQSDGSAKALGVTTDVTDPDSIQAMVAAAEQSFGGIDVLVNNAGSYPHVGFEEITYQAWRDVINVNLDSVFLCCQAALPALKESRGKIVNVATSLVWNGLEGMCHYVAAKSGVLGFSKSLARELGKWGITVNVIAPGAVVPAKRLTEEGQARMNEIINYQCVKRGQRPEDLLGMMRFMCSSESDFISGQAFTVDGGLTTH